MYCECGRLLTLLLEPHAHQARWRLLGRRQSALAQQRVCEVHVLLAVIEVRALLRRRLVVPKDPTNAHTQC